jgi:hypothetical protein
MGTYTDLLKLKPIQKQSEMPAGEVVLADFSPPDQNTQGNQAERTTVHLPPDPVAAKEASSVETERTEIRTIFRSEKRTVGLPVKRRTKRYSFEFYEDQIFRLKLLKRDAEDRGENVSLSDIAREALDRYLQLKKK